MSAYLVSSETINLIASAASRFHVRVYDRPDVVRRGPFEGWRDHTIDGRTDTEAIASVLWAENIYSVEARYPGETFATLPGPDSATTAHRYRPIDTDLIGPAPHAIILKSIACLRYQSCESDDYAQSLGARLLDAIEAEVVRHLPGYEAAPWGWSKADGDAWIASVKAKVLRGPMARA